MIPTPAPEPTDATTAPMPQTQGRVRFRARGYRILIKPEPHQRSFGRIALPDSTNTEGAPPGDRHWSGLTVRTAKVISVGPGLIIPYREGGSIWKGYRDEEGTARWPMHGIKPGDRILYREWSGHDVVIDNEKFEIIISNSVDAKILPDGKLDLIEDRLLVRRRPAINQSRGGIWIPDIAKKTPLEGEVVQVGYGKVITNGTITPMGPAIGDRVALRPMKGVDVTRYVPHYSKRAIGVMGPLRVNGEIVDQGRTLYESREVTLLFETDLIGVIEGEEHFEPVVSLTREQ